MCIHKIRERSDAGEGPKQSVQCVVVERAVRGIIAAEGTKVMPCHQTGRERVLGLWRHGRIVTRLHLHTPVSHSVRGTCG